MSETRASDGSVKAARRPPTVDEVVRRYVLARLAENAGNKVKTAAECGISLKTLYNWLAKWGVGR